MKSNVLESLRETVGRPTSVTGKELRGDLLKLAELVPDTDDVVFEQDGGEAAEASSRTIAQLLGAPQQAAPAQQPTEAAAQKVDVTAIALALGVETNDPRELALAVMSLKASSVPVEKLRELESTLASVAAKTAEERIEIEIARQRKAGKQITPGFEAELLRVAKSDIDLALSSLAGVQVTSIDLATQADKPAPTVERLEAARQRAEDRSAELPGGASESIKASTATHEETLAIASEKGLSYTEANKLRLDARRAA